MKQIKWIQLGCVAGLLAACSPQGDGKRPKQAAEPASLTAEALAPLKLDLVSSETPEGFVEEITLSGLGDVDRQSLKEREIYIPPVIPDTPPPCSEEQRARGGCPSPTYAATALIVPRFAAPFQAQIIFTGFPENAELSRPKWELQHLCGGTLIAEDWVITAAHCFDTDARDPRSGKIYSPFRSCANDQPFKDIDTTKFAVRLDVGNISNENAKTRQIEDVFCRDYNIGRRAGDIALVKLKPDAGPVTTVKTVAAPTAYVRYDSGTHQSLGLVGSMLKQGSFLATRIYDYNDQLLLSWDLDTGAFNDWSTYTSGKVSFVGDDQLLVIRGREVMITAPKRGAAARLFITEEPIVGAALLRDATRLAIWTNNPESGAEFIEIWNTGAGERLHRLIVPPPPDLAGPIVDVRLGFKSSVIAHRAYKEVLVWPSRGQSEGYQEVYQFDATIGTDPALPSQLPREQTKWPVLRPNGKSLLLMDATGGTLYDVNLINGEATSRQFLDRAYHSEYSDKTRRLATIGAGEEFEDSLGFGTINVASRLQLWDVRQGKELLQIDSRSGYFSLGFSQNGRRLLFLDRENLIKIWNASNGKLLAELTTDEDVSLTGATFLDPAGTRLLANASGDGVTFIWNLKRPDEQPLRLDHSLPVSHLSIEENGNTLLTGSEFGNAAVWDTRTGTALTKVFQKGEVAELDLVDRSTLMVSTRGRKINLWDIETGELKMRFNDRGTAYDPDLAVEDDTVIEFVSPSGIAEKRPASSSILVAYGWGRTGMDGDAVNPSAVLRMLGLQRISPEKCASMTSLDVADMDESYFCAFAPARKTCVGDSGGPIIARGASRGERLLVGVISGSNHQCTDDGTPGFYTDVAKYSDWIAETVCARSQDAMRAHHLCVSSGEDLPPEPF